ncbi:MAG: hypothetical protein ACOCRO_00665 [Halanaerobiales bacterium]
MKIRLGRQRFWLDAWRFEIWPELLSKLPLDMEADTAKELALKYLNVEMDEEGRLGKNEELYGLFSGHKVKNDGSYIINGVHLIDNGSLTEVAIDLIKLFKEDEQHQWMLLLAEQILKYSPRIRAVFIPMLEEELVFEKGWFVPFYNKTSLEYENEIYYPFSSKKEDKNLNSLLNKLGYKALGPWWLAEIDTEVDDNLTWRGLRSEEPSLSGLGQLRNPFEIFRSLKWIDSNDNKSYYVDIDKLKSDISPDLYKDLTGGEIEKDELDLLKELIKEYQDLRGFFSIREVGNEIYNRLNIEEDKERWVEKYFKTLLADNKINILDHQSGQPRHGRGLYDMRDYQLLKIEFLE